MLLALLSDTHDHIANTRAGLALLAARRPAAYIHCGDVCSAEMLALFARLPDFHFVFGNNDYDHPALRAEAKCLGLHCHGRFADLTLAGKRLAVSHGDDFAARTRVLAAQTYDYLFTGHTHVCADSRPTKRTRQINPGALYRASEKSVALLDLDTDSLEFLTVSPAP